MRLPTLPGFEHSPPDDGDGLDLLLSLELTAGDVAMLARLPLALASLDRAGFAATGAALFNQRCEAEAVADHAAAMPDAPDALVRDAGVHAYRLRLMCEAVAREMRHRTGTGDPAAL